QYEVERALTDRALAAGVTLLRGAEVRGLRQDADGVEVTQVSDGAEHAVRAAYLVGADGHHSRVRGALGLGFPGEAVVRSLVLADVRMTDPPSEQLTVDGNADGFCFVVPFGDGWYRVIARDRRRELPDDAPRRAHRDRVGRPGGVRNRLRHARPPLDVAVPQRGAAGRALPGGPGVPRGRRRARALARRRHGDEHGAAGRRQPGLEARGGGAGPRRRRAARHLPRRA